MKTYVITAITAKDLKESAANSQVLLPAILLPLLLVVLYPTGLLIGLRYVSEADAAEFVADIPLDFFPGTEGLDIRGQAAYVATVYLFAAFFLIIPTMMATILAANSFAGEKERHTLEGVLYTPVSDTELVLGKMLGAAVPSVALSWLCFIIYTALVNIFGTPLVGRFFFPTLNWWVLMLLLVPVVVVLVTAGVAWVSARVNSYQSANAIAGLAVLPVLLLVVGQVTGVMLAGAGLFAILAMVLAVVDVLLVRWIARTFDRERIVASFL